MQQIKAAFYIIITSTVIRGHLAFEGLLYLIAKF